jgi:phospholipid/cholesterol/gamma-HCH transport system permease protein
MASAEPRFAVESRTGGAALVFRGDWRIDSGAPLAAKLVKAIRTGPAPAVLACDCRGLGEWDSLFVTVLRHCRAACVERGIRFDAGGAPEGVRRLLALADTVAVHERPASTRPGWFYRLVTWAHAREFLAELVSVCAFAGEIVIALARLCTGKARTRLVDLLWFVQQAGPRAIGIVTLISVLVGMILAYLGSVQLKQLGAQVYVAHLVGLGMVREMGALMTGVIMAGRTGAAYAAQLGTMQTREEIDAIETLGISPIEFLVLPRMLALVLVMPLLCIYSDVLGMLGGAIVALAMDVTWVQYQNGLREAVTIAHILTGVAKSVVFGALIAAAGCRAGIRCGRSSEAVGQATTTAVVKSIVYLVVADAAFNIIYQRLGI